MRTTFSIELLAPAGNMAAFVAAMEEGADAVYVGAPGFNARALSRDFSFQEIAAMVQHAHGLNRKLYVAMNSLIKEPEVASALQTLAVLEKIQPDALIIQDLGLFYLAQHYFPSLKLHASTLLSVHNSRGAGYFSSLGFERVVLARELSMEEIGIIGRESGAELEIFIHGAMCFSYSGLCMFSSLYGGKSSLRGQCVQPCRRRYTMQKKGRKGAVAKGSGKGEGYFFSMNDLSGIDLLRSIQQAGVASLKVEGRLKSVEYVRKTIRAYRLSLDALGGSNQEQQKVQEEAGHLLEEAMGRKRSTGFLSGEEKSKAVTPHLSGNTGVMVGKVVRVDKSQGTQTRIQVKLQQPVQVGDRLRYHEEKTGERYSFSLRSLHLGKKVSTAGKKGQEVSLSVPRRLSAIKGKKGYGQIFRIDVAGNKSGQREGGKKVRAVSAVPKVNQQEFDRIVKELHIQAAGEEGGTPLKGRRFNQGKGKGKKQGVKKALLQWWVKVPTLQHTRYRLPVRAEKFIVPLSEANVQHGLRLSKTRAKLPPLLWSLPAVIQEDRTSWFADSIQSLLQAGFHEFQVANIGQVAFFKEQHHGVAERSFSLFGNYQMNALNSPALRFAQASGLAGMIFSLETDRRSLAQSLTAFFSALGGKKQQVDSTKVGLLLYGRPPLFSSRLDADHFHAGRQLISPRGEKFYLNREEGLTCVRAADPFSLLDYTAELASMGLGFGVLDLSCGHFEREVATLSAFLYGKGEKPACLTGNYDGELL